MDAGLREHRDRGAGHLRRPERETRARARSARVRLERGPRGDAGCRLPTSESEGRTTYRVRRIRYAAGRPAAVEIRAETSIPFSVRALGALELPEFPARRRYLGGPADDDSEASPRILALRRREIGADADRGTPLGVDLRDGDGDDELDSAVVYATTGDGAGTALASWNGPATVNRRRILPPSIHSSSVHAGLAVELDLRQIELRDWSDYPVRVADADVLEPVSFSRELSSTEEGEDSWETKLGAFIERLEFAAGPASEGPARASFGVAATQTAPIGTLESLLVTLEDRTEAKFQLVVRRSRQLGPDFTPYVRRGAIRFPLEEGPPREETRTGARFLNLHVRATVEGFEIAAGGRTLPPVDGCPDPGATICLADDEKGLRKPIEQAESLQRDRRLKAADRALVAALEHYDWAALYRNIRQIHERYSDASRVYLSADPGLPVAAAVRMLNLARYRLRRPDSEKCNSEFDDNGALWRARVCTDDEGRPRTMFDRAVWRIE